MISPTRRYFSPLRIPAFAKPAIVIPILAFALLTSACRTVSDDQSVGAPGPGGPPTFAGGQVSLLQPSAVVAARVEPESFAQYVRTVRAAADQYWQARRGGNPRAPFVYVALKPGKRSRVWCELPLAPAGTAPVTELTRRLNGIAAPEVRGGLVVLVITPVFPGQEPATGGLPAVLPREWNSGAAGQRLTGVEEMVARAWPD